MFRYRQVSLNYKSTVCILQCFLLLLDPGLFLTLSVHTSQELFHAAARSFGRKLYNIPIHQAIIR